MYVENYFYRGFRPSAQVKIRTDIWQAYPKYLTYYEIILFQPKYLHQLYIYMYIHFFDLFCLYSKKGSPINMYIILYNICMHVFINYIYKKKLYLMKLSNF